MKPTLLILAAGMGSRYGGLKQLDEVGQAGEAIMDYSIYDALKAGFGKVVFVIRRDFEQEFKEKIASRWEGKTEIGFAFQGPDTYVPAVPGQVERAKPWGTGHAVLVAKDVVREPFVAINADDFYGFSGFQKMAEFLVSDCQSTHYGMVGYVLKNTLSENGAVSRGVCSMDENHLLRTVTECTGIEETQSGIFYKSENGKAPLNGNSLVSMNIWGFHPHIFELLQKGFNDFVEKNAANSKAEFYISSFANDLINSGTATFKVLPNDEKWYGVTYREDKETVQRAFVEMTRAGKYPVPLWGRGRNEE
ncbi:MAG: nucleotidyltransferase [Bacteroidetes bacterium]|nr:nucleotidyltransferase [Bacteroidota bacterium]